MSRTDGENENLGTAEINVAKPNGKLYLPFTIHRPTDPTGKNGNDCVFREYITVLDQTTCSDLVD